MTTWPNAMDRDTEKVFWKKIRTHDPAIRPAYPHYLIIENTSGHKNFNAPKTSEFEALTEVLTPLLDPEKTVVDE